MIHIGGDIFLTEMGGRIARRRKELHLTQEQLAEKVGVSLQTISCIELGKKGARPQNIYALAQSLNVSTDYLLSGKQSESQMNETIEKLSELPADKYRAIQTLINLLCEQQ